MCGRLGSALVRAKGFVQLAGEPRRAFLERAGDRLTLQLRRALAARPPAQRDRADRRGARPGQPAAPAVGLPRAAEVPLSDETSPRWRRAAAPAVDPQPGQLLESWALVLVALGIEHEVEDLGGHASCCGWRPPISDGPRPRWRPTIASVWPRPASASPPRPTRAGRRPASARPITLAAFYFVTGGRDTGPARPLVQRRARPTPAASWPASWSATVTALTLHADPMHLARQRHRGACCWWARWGAGWAAGWPAG